MRIFLFSCLLLVSIDFLSGQCTPPAVDACEDANVLCSLDEVNGYSCHNIDYSNPSGCSPLCPTGGGTHNTSWWAFVTNGGQVCLTMLFNNCTVNGTGVQFGIWGDCNCGESIFCDPACNGPSVKSFCVDLKPCRTYYLFVDGCSGDVCDFTINTTGGTTPIAPDVKSILGEKFPCLNQCAIYTADMTSGDCQPSFQWTLDGVEINQYNKEILLSWTEEGDFILCSTSMVGNPASGSVCSSGRTHCESIKVRELKAGYGVTSRICQYKFPFHWGKKLITGSGIFTETFAFSNCCTVDSTREFIMIPDGEPPCDESTYMRGIIFLDVDKNTLFNGQDQLLNNYLLYNLPSNFSTLSVNGKYTLDLARNTTNEVLVQVPSSKYFTTVPDHYSIPIVNQVGLIPGSYDFAVQYKDACDLAISVAGGLARPAGRTRATLTITNEGPIRIGTSFVELKFPAHWTFEKSSHTVSTLIGSTIRWKISTPIHRELIKITADFNIPIGEPLGNTYTYIAKVENAYDINVSNNEFQFSDIIRNSFDPNDKKVNFNWIKEPVNGVQQELTYTVRFQNVGNHPAKDVIILDTLSQKLDHRTIRLVNYSHPCKLTMKKLGFVKFIFENIDLPDTSIGWLESQGFVQFAIRPYENFENGTKILNSAHIIFDQNVPIKTNEVCTNIVATGLQDIEMRNKFYIAPNPVKEKFYLYGDNENFEKFKIKIVDINGKIVWTKDKLCNCNPIELDISLFVEGIYQLILYKSQIPIVNIPFIRY